MIDIFLTWIRCNCASRLKFKSAVDRFRVCGRRSFPFCPRARTMSTGDSAESPSASPSPVKSVESLDEIEIDSGPRKANIFALYAKIFRLLLTTQIPNFSLLTDELRNRELEKLILPSDEDWRHRVYHSLVELQREKDAEVAEDRK